MKQARIALLLAALSMPILCSIASGASDADDFKMRSTEDLVDLCSTKPEEANYIAAIHFCHGFASGAYQYYEALAPRPGQPKLACFPDPPPARSEVLAEFVTWARARPEVLKEKPVDGLFRFLGDRYSCKKK